MAVIITNMDIPKNCLNCKFNHSSCWCSLTKNCIDREFEYRERLDDCPLKSTDEMLNKIDSLKLTAYSYDALEIIDIIHKYCDKESI